MTFPCDECESIFKEKRNLMQHMKTRHGLKKFKCNFCDYRSNDRKTLKRHENNKHNDELFKCLQCDYRSARKDMLKRHIHAIHMEKNIRCDQCEYVTDSNNKLKRHVHVKHEVKTCNECEFSTTSLHKLKNHKKTQHPPDDFYEEQAFKKALYNKIWRVRGVQDLMEGLKVYKPKIQNTLRDYMKEKDRGAKWSLGVLVEMVKTNWNGDIIETIYPGFRTNPFLQLAMFNFDQYYGDAVNKIQDKLIAFHENGSGWVLKNVHNISINIAVYEPTLGNTKEYEEDMLKEYEEDMLIEDVNML